MKDLKANKFTMIVPHVVQLCTTLSAVIEFWIKTVIGIARNPTLDPELAL